MTPMRTPIRPGLPEARESSAGVDARALEDALRRSVRGEVRFDAGSRAAYSTDGSNYRQVPIGVVVPATTDDVVATVAACAEHGAPVLNRAGGTSLAGQCCNVAVVLDHTKYLNRILELDPWQRVARVQPGQTERLAVVTQTTLSVDDAAEISAAVKKRFPKIREPKQQDICYATQNRQDAVKLLAKEVDVMIVVGSQTSSNSNRLAELSRKLGVPAYMVDSVDDLRPEWVEGKQRVGLTAGASEPEVLVKAVIRHIRAFGAVTIRKMDGIEETVKFPLPKGLKL